MATNAHNAQDVSDRRATIARALLGADRLTDTQRRQIGHDGDLVTLPFGMAAGRRAREGRGVLRLGRDTENAVHVLDVRGTGPAEVRVHEGTEIVGRWDITPADSQTLPAYVHFVADRRGWAADAVALEALD